MKKALLLLLLLIQSFSIFAQDEVKSFVQQKAYPKEGLQTFMEEFVNKFDYKNADKIPNDVTEIKLRLKFVVEKDGTFNDITLVDDTYNFKNEVIRILNEMPTWNAAVHEGDLVRSSFTMPIRVNYDHSKSSSETDFFVNKNQINSYVETLNSNKIETDYFDLTCNCTIVKTSRNSELTTEEFFLMAIDDKVSYTIGFKKLEQQKAIDEIQKIKKEAEQQQVYVRDVVFMAYNNALNVAFYMNEGGYDSQYQTLFVPAKNYLVLISLRSGNKQLTNLSFAHLLKNFKLKI
ncbi:hypothetical protein [Paenimyroides aestuarii]|uniref:TonB C-terminal domain-containing protein n=1 Tax=Paenimyroides aestuarii TaxID=2968490 RepID=A0ABY5NTI6_9FLAO|nr:hypothetical protein [Paenimyroides aestuarii]UUV21895.1 hypothetical protein NPX36_02245 [Paenimyroides aestuarii]